MEVTYSPDEALAHAVFEAVMGALSQPGQINTLPQSGLEQFVETLIDLDTTTHNLVPALDAPIRASRTRLVPLAAALHVFVPDAKTATAIVRKLAVGSALYPDRGATLYLTAAHRGTRLRLTGPGIRSALEVECALPPAFWQGREAVAAYPEGFELVVIDGDKVMAIPRSTKVECL